MDLELTHNRTALAYRIKADIDAYCSYTYNDGPRRHLGASVIGQDCTRAAYYDWRWFGYQNSDGRMARLFRRGHLEEKRYIEYLTGIGFQVFDTDSAGNQFKCSAVNGHFGGSLDSILRAPARYGLDTDLVFLGEYKTKGTGSGYVNISKNGIKVENFQHYVQMCVYGRTYGFKYAIYIVTNKNDDDLTIEIVPLDPNIADNYLRRADYVINSGIIPAKLSLQPTHFKCKGCSHLQVCHYAKTPDKNCRTCVHSKAVENGEWQCGLRQAIIPRDVEPVGCSSWVAIQ